MTGDFDEFDALEGYPVTAEAEVAALDAPVQVEPVQVEPVGVDEPDVAGVLAPTTGHQRVDAATALLDGLEDLPTAGHADVFEDVHRRLQGALSDLDGD